VALNNQRTEGSAPARAVLGQCSVTCPLKQPGSLPNTDMEIGDITFGVCIIYIYFFIMF